MTLDEIKALPDVPHGSGLYFLWDAGELVYIGASKDLGQRTYNHWTAHRFGNLTGGYRQSIKHDKATGILWPVESMRAKERELIAALQPRCNIQNTPRKRR